MLPSVRAHEHWPVISEGRCSILDPFACKFESVRIRAGGGGPGVGSFYPFAVGCDVCGQLGTEPALVSEARFRNPYDMNGFSLEASPVPNAEQIQVGTRVVC